MAFEFILLIALVIIFIVSFCGLLQKIRQTYERERNMAERAARRQETAAQRIGISDLYVNSSFISDERDGTGESVGVFPSAPPPYTQFYMEPPPKYEDIFKENPGNESVIEEIVVPRDSSRTSGEQQRF